MAIFDHTMQFKLLTLSQHYNYSRQGVSGITVKCQCFHGLSFPSKYENSLLITHYSLLITHYSLLITHYSLLITHYSEYKHPNISKEANELRRKIPVQSHKRKVWFCFTNSWNVIYFGYSNLL
jgi:hypothetical protein